MQMTNSKVGRYISGDGRLFYSIIENGDIYTDKYIYMSTKTRMVSVRSSVNQIVSCDKKSAELKLNIEGASLI